MSLVKDVYRTRKLYQRGVLCLSVSALLTASACGNELSLDAETTSLDATQSELRGLGFPFRYRQLNVQSAFKDATLLRSASNPDGIFTSDDTDNTPISDASARHELLAVGQSRQPSWVRYIDEGPRTQDVVIFFHGIPTYTYLWREVIGPVAKSHRVIAFDQLGQGFSTKHRNLSYTFKQHLAHAEAFIEALNLPEDGKITIVTHDTGGAVGFAFAARHPELIKSIVSFETVYGPAPSDAFFPERAVFFRSPEGQEAIVENNAFIEDLIFRGHEIVPPGDRPFIVDELKRIEKVAYALPYLRKDNRRVLAAWPSQIPSLTEPPSSPAQTNLELFTQYQTYLSTTSTPKLFFYAEPGVILTSETVPPTLDLLDVDGSLTAINLGKGFHYLQEDHGVRIGQEIHRWLRELDGLPENPSADFPYRSRFREVLGSRMHYIDEGKGSPILMLHGNPTSSYLWRNIVPFLTPKHRVIAVDLIGMGLSDRPNIDYSFAENQRYLEAFIESLGLEDITLVIHDWGSALGLDYARRHPKNIRGIVMMEAILPPTFPASFDALNPFLFDFFQNARDPVLGPQLILEQNIFIEETLPGNILRSLTEKELDIYRAPYPTPESRIPLLAWPNEVPIDGIPPNVVAAVENYSEWLMESDTPKLHLYVEPGVLNPQDVIEYLSERVPQYEPKLVGAGLHFIQEDLPEAIGLAIADWLARVVDR